MHFKTVKLILAASAFMLSSSAYSACKSDVAKDDLTDEQVNALYDCIKDEMAKGYASQGGKWTDEYRSWGKTASQPAAPGFHGKRFLLTTVNETGHAEYIKFSDERGPMPEGTVIAKESFTVNKKNDVKKGPLFFMEKVAAGGDADNYGNWVYSLVQPNGKPGKISQKFCHDCHGNYEDQDALGYPVEDYRVSAE